jgi:tRNA A37 threonylcarbamoyltransferase TsaD
VTALGQELQLAVYLPPLSYTTDNAAMIGAAGAFAFQHKRFGQVSDAAKAKWNKYE